MEGTSRLPKQRSRPYAQSALGLALSLLLPFAGCKHAPATQSRPITKDSHSQQPAAAPAAASASVQVLSPGPRFAVQVAAFNRREDAEALASQLSEQYGLQALVAPVEAHGATLYRVRLLVENKDQAEIVANTFLHTENKKVWIVALQ